MHDRGLRGAAHARQAEKQKNLKVKIASYQPGDQVIHTKFGNGTVIECKIVHDDEKPVKTILIAMDKIEIMRAVVC
jgi:hypothetical protein